MIIFQTAGSGEFGGMVLKGGLLLSSQPPSTTFRTNAYIHRLNRTLRAELRAVSAYAALARQKTMHSTKKSALLTDHQLASRELVRLVIANRGIPDDQPALQMGLTSTVIRFCRLAPPRLAQRAANGTMTQMERHLLINYRRLLRMAPPADIPVLAALIKRREQQAFAVGEG